MKSTRRYRAPRSGTPAQVTDSKTAVIYCRVSSREQEEEGYSVDAQLRLLREYAEKKGFRVAQEFIEAETAKKSGRKAFDEMLRFCRDRNIKTILTEKTDRLYRNFADFVKVDELGVDLHFVKEGQIIRQDSHSSEKLIHSIKVCLAKNYADNLSEEIRKGLQEKALQGIYPTHSPIGYLNVPEGRRKVIAPDPEKAPLVAELFLKYAEGKMSLKQLAKYASDRGLRTKKGQKMPKSSVAATLTNPIYCGRMIWKGQEYPATHVPLISTELFDKVQEIMMGRTTRLGYGSIEIQLRRIVKCSFCDGYWVGERKKGKYVYYHCTGKQYGCPAPYGSEEMLLRQIKNVLADIAIPRSVIPLLQAELKRREEGKVSAAKGEQKRLENEIRATQDKLAALFEHKVKGDLSEDTYALLRERHEKELVALRKKEKELPSATRNWDDVQSTLELLATAYLRFGEANNEECSTMIKKLNSNFYFDGKTLLLKGGFLVQKAQELVKVELGQVGTQDPKTGHFANWSG